MREIIDGDRGMLIYGPGGENFGRELLERMKKGGNSRYADLLKRGIVVLAGGFFSRGEKLNEITKAFNEYRAGKIPAKDFRWSFRDTPGNFGADDNLLEIAKLVKHDKEFFALLRGVSPEFDAFVELSLMTERGRFMSELIAAVNLSWVRENYIDVCLLIGEEEDVGLDDLKLPKIGSGEMKEKAPSRPVDLSSYLLFGWEEPEVLPIEQRHGRKFLAKFSYQNPRLRGIQIGSATIGKTMLIGADYLERWSRDPSRYGGNVGRGMINRIVTAYSPVLELDENERKYSWNRRNRDVLDEVIRKIVELEGELEIYSGNLRVPVRQLYDFSRKIKPVGWV